MDAIGQLAAQIDQLLGIVRDAPPSPALRDTFAI
jgi:hypothetical protein